VKCACGFSGAAGAGVLQQLARQHAHGWCTMPHVCPAGLDRVVVAVLDSGVELASGGVGPSVWANAAEVASDGVDNDGNGEAAAVLCCALCSVLCALCSVLPSHLSKHLHLCCFRLR
jgi:hypothetical protein